jgi:protein-S-isoprenylcysteine O-methyltransferase Ste14
LGWGSLLAFLVFLFVGSLHLVNLGLDRSGVLWFDAGLSLSFFIQHSAMIRKSTRRWLTRLVPEIYSGALYTIVSGVVLLAAVLLWQGSDVSIVSLSGLGRWSLRVVSLAALAGFVWGIRSLKFFDPFGVRPILSRLRGKTPKPVPLVAAGAYRWVRHPLYLFMLLMIWASPDLTADRLLFNILWTLWVVVGTIMEERDLIAEFGDTYREYRRNVPMLIPGLIWPRRAPKNG